MSDALRCSCLCETEQGESWGERSQSLAWAHIWLPRELQVSAGVGGPGGRRVVLSLHVARVPGSLDFPELTPVLRSPDFPVSGSWLLSTWSAANSERVLASFTGCAFFSQGCVTGTAAGGCGSG